MKIVNNITVTESKIYIAEDGTEFDTYDKCYIYENKMDEKEEYRKFHERTKHIELTDITENSYNYDYDIAYYINNQEEFNILLKILPECEKNCHDYIFQGPDWYLVSMSYYDEHIVDITSYSHIYETEYKTIKKIVDLLNY